jgi:hypothetical protein
MKYRPACGGLVEAMGKAVRLDDTKHALAVHLKEPVEDIEVKPYAYDERIQWHTYLVTVRGSAVGFTNEGV